MLCNTAIKHGRWMRGMRGINAALVLVWAPSQPSALVSSSLSLTFCQCFGWGSSWLSRQTDRVVKTSGPWMGKRPTAQTHHHSSDTDTIACWTGEVTHINSRAHTGRLPTQMYIPVCLFPPNNPLVQQDYCMWLRLRLHKVRDYTGRSWGMRSF